MGLFITYTRSYTIMLVAVDEKHTSILYYSGILINGTVRSTVHSQVLIDIS